MRQHWMSVSGANLLLDKDADYSYKGDNSLSAILNIRDSI